MNKLCSFDFLPTQFSALMLLGLALTLNSCYLLPPRGNGGWGGGQGGGQPAGNGGGQSSDTYIDSNFPDQFWQQNAEQRGVIAERHDYLPAGENAKGVMCRRYIDIYKPKNVKPKGIIVLWHGGGFDVGNADTQVKAEEAIGLTERGYIVCSGEYRRGWTDVQFGSGRDPFSVTPREYARLETAVFLAVDDAKEAMRYVRKELGDDLPMFIQGTSAGGSIVLYTAIIDPNFRGEVNIIGAISGYGGISTEDVIPDIDIPVILAGGLNDPIVPFYEGWYYEAENKSKMGRGVGYVYEELAPRNQPVCLLATCNGEHGFGAVTRDECWDLLFDLVDDTSNLPADTYYTANHRDGTRTEQANCN